MLGLKSNVSRAEGLCGFLDKDCLMEEHQSVLNRLPAFGEWEWDGGTREDLL